MRTLFYSGRFLSDSYRKKTKKVNSSFDIYESDDCSID